jgi:sec-independent protein translocase protein TatA
VFDISPIQIMLVLVIALLVFGPKRLPEMARMAGREIRDFRSGMSGAPARRAEPRAAAPAPAPAPEAHDDDDVLAGVVVPGDAPPASRDRTA